MGGFCDKLERPIRIKKKILRFPRKAITGRRRQRGSISNDTDLVYSHFGAYDVHCDYPLRKLHCKVSTTEEYSYIIDTSGLIQNEWNPVEHIKYRGLIKVQPFSVKIAPFEFVVTQPDEVWFNIFEGIHANIPQPDDNTMDDLAAMSTNHFRNAVDNTGESLANFFIELIQTCQGNIKALKKYKTLWEKCLAKYEEAYKRYIRAGHTGPASSWLAWNFAIKTNISDLKRLLCSFHRARKRFEWLRSRNLKPTKIQFGRDNCYDPPDTFILDGYVPSVSYVSDLTLPCHDPDTSLAVEFISYLELKKLKYELKYSATGFVIFSIPGWVFEEIGRGQGLVWAAQEGFTNPLKIAWNSIPYTWIVDWFVSYRTHLQEQSADLSPLKDAAITYSAHSFKLKSQWQVSHVYFDDEGRHEQVLGVVDYDSYVRKIGLPLSEENPFRVPWSGYNLSIIAALIIQWSRRRH
jgi:hypothetical protein